VLFDGGVVGGGSSSIKGIFYEGIYYDGNMMEGKRKCQRDFLLHQADAYERSITDTFNGTSVKLSFDRQDSIHIANCRNHKTPGHSYHTILRS
jgi:hypothetical protein